MPPLDTLLTLALGALAAAEVLLAGWGDGRDTLPAQEES